MSFISLLYIGVVGMECGIYLCNALFFIIRPMKGRRFRGYMSVLSLVLLFVMSMEMLTYIEYNLTGPDSLMQHTNYIMYFFAIPASATLILSIILPQWSNRRLIRFCLLSEIGPTYAMVVQCIWDNQIMLYINCGLTVLYCFVIFVFCRIRLVKYERAVFDTFSDTEGRSVSWINTLIVLFGISMAAYCLALEFDNIEFLILEAVLDIMTFVVACIFVDHQKSVLKVIAEKLTAGGVVQEPLPVSTTAGTGNAEGIVIKAEDTDEAMELTVKYKAIAMKLKTVFEERSMFLKPDITSHDVANAIGTNERYLSYFLNNVMEKTFHSYVTGLRTDYAKNLLDNNRRIDIEDVAYKSGYSSSTAFCRSFKKMYGISPKAYRSKTAKESKAGMSSDNAHPQSEAGQASVAHCVDIIANEVQASRLSSLNAREIAVCDAIRSGKKSKEIAASMNISPESLRVSKSRILRKLDPEKRYHKLKDCLESIAGQSVRKD